MDVLKKIEVELKLRGCSNRTIENYKIANQKFLDYTKKDYNEITQDDIKLYLSELISQGKSARTLNLVRSGIKFFYDEILGKNIANIKTPKIERTLPTVLTKDEIKRLIECASARKSKLLIEMLYSSGLRVSECIHLKIEDLELSEGIGWVRAGKGKKDRMIIVSERIKKELGEYLKEEGIEKGEIFKGRDDGVMTTRNVQKIIHLAAKTAGIKKNVTPHKLRHSFATHLLEAGTNIRVIQELLGHSNLQTTQIYTQVSTQEIKKVKSPLDNL